ncbi:MAG: DivIVA domain-containing protein [Clostridiales Family XIII bacterium]|jgi:cell division initiation protein|nr:DivIVA domain-containing protein [Clostridiales Family XIII bacterium]
MISPAEIQDKTFTRGVRGYKEDEVDKFLDLITLDFNSLLQEMQTLREINTALRADIEHYRSTEGTIFDTLESAKALMADISASAEKRADIVLKNAELDADRIQREARESVERVREESAAMAQRWEQFKTRYKNLLQNELDRFEDMSSDLMNGSNAQSAGFFTDYRTSGGARPPAKPAVSAAPVKDSTIKSAKE